MNPTVWIARHGNRQDFVDPEWRRSAPRPHDPALSEDGIEQAKRLGERLADEGLTHIFASPFLRTVQTAHHVAEATGLSIGVEPLICEWLNVEWFPENPQVLPVDTLAELYPTVDPAYQTLGIPTYPETAEDAYGRAGYAVQELAERYAGNILLVGHGISVSGAAYGLVQNLEPFEVALCSLFKIGKHEEGWLAELCADVSHLAEAIGADRLV